MTNKEDNLKICCICGKHYHGYGNNAEPVKDGKYCDECNYNKDIVLSGYFDDGIITVKVHSQLLVYGL